MAETARRSSFGGGLPRTSSMKGAPEAGRKRSAFYDEMMRPRKSIALSPTERQSLHEAFTRVVGDKPGIASVEQLKELLEMCNESGEEQGELEKWFVQADANKDGLLDLDEFVAYLEELKLKSHVGAPNSDLVATFVAFGGNTDLTGCVDISIIASVLQEFELDYSLEGMLPDDVSVATPSADSAADGASPTSAKPVPGEQNNINSPTSQPDTGMVDFGTFRQIFGHLLTQRHFRAPSFSDM